MLLISVCFLEYFSYLCSDVKPIENLRMIQKDFREHYYYVTNVGGVTIFKAFNKKSLKVSHGVLDKNIMARFRHYTDAYGYALTRCTLLDVPLRPRYVSVTGNDTID